MIALCQRVSQASVRVDDQVIGHIDNGMLALIGVQRSDGSAQVVRMAERLLGYRMFNDDAGRMNRCLKDTGGGLLLVPQFTLAANTDKGTRASFAQAADPAMAESLFEELLGLCRQQHDAGRVASGRFGADMQVALVNEGPVTFSLQAR